MAQSNNEIDFFEIFPWDKNFETGVAEIDVQHKKLVSILNQLAAHLANLSTQITLNNIFQELAEYADYHFKTEEKIWSRYLSKDSWYANHEQVHQTFMGKVVAIKNNENEEPFDDVIKHLVSFLSKWLAHHILDSDKRMAKAVQAIESGCSIDEAKARADEEMSGSMRVLVETVLTMYDKLSSRTMNLMREKAMRKQAEVALKKSEEQLQSVIKGSGESLWDWDLGHGGKHHPEINETLFNFFPSTSDNSQEDLSIHPNDVDRVNRDLQAHLKNETEFFSSKHRVLTKGGGWSWRLS
jgi:hemerythrin-like metal-binding protein